jgi:hypothetical protein
MSRAGIEMSWVRIVRATVSLPGSCSSSTAGMAALQRMRLWASTAQQSHAALALK